jgi:NADH-quinone oxidoreductase subunit F
MATAAERPLTARFPADGAPLDLAGYERAGGYEAVRGAIGRRSPREIIDVVTASGLRGRGGAGFPTGRKWSLVPEDAPHPRYVVANADEMEPGTFKDRILLERDPHQFLEGIVLASYAVQADAAYIFLRGEYTQAEEILRGALAEAYDKGYLGRRVAGADYALEIHLHTSAGRYICGEETALLSALEGKRATPRFKPPYPPVSGLWGKPTVVQNVETLCCVPHIVARGAEWFRALSRGSKDTGTKIYGASGRLRRPGAWELPMGTPLRELLEEHGGGMRDGFAFRGALPGGASTDFLVADHLDLAMDFESVQAAGSRLGTGTVIVLDDRTCPVGMIRNIEAFFAQESCGWCTPCRDGLPWTERLLGALEDGEGEPEDLDRLEQHTRFLGTGFTFCALAPGAMEPLQSGLKYFRDDFERHVIEHRCPFRS